MLSGKEAQDPEGYVEDMKREGSFRAEIPDSILLHEESENDSIDTHTHKRRYQKQIRSWLQIHPFNSTLCLSELLPTEADSIHSAQMNRLFLSCQKKSPFEGSAGVL